MALFSPLRAIIVSLSLVAAPGCHKKLTTRHRTVPVYEMRRSRAGRPPPCPRAETEADFAGRSAAPASPAVAARPDGYVWYRCQVSERSHEYHVVENDVPASVGWGILGVVVFTLAALVTILGALGPAG